MFTRVIFCSKRLETIRSESRIPSTSWLGKRKASSCQSSAKKGWWVPWKIWGSRWCPLLNVSKKQEIIDHYHSSMGKLTISTGRFSNCKLLYSHYQRVKFHQIPLNHDFPMLFLWISYAYAMFMPSTEMGCPSMTRLRPAPLAEVQFGIGVNVQVDVSQVQSISGI